MWSRYFGQVVTIGIIVIGLAFSRIVHADHGLDYDCRDFPNQAAAQSHLRAHPWDPDGIDRDRDGIACESLPCPCDRSPVARTSAPPSVPATIPSRPSPTPTLSRPSPTPTPSRLASPVTTGTTQLGASTVTFFSAIPAGMVALCPQPGEWLLLYWRGAATPIAAALAACPGADRAWVQRGQQWLAFAVGVPSGVSDDFTLVSNEAVFLHGAGGGRAAPAPAGLTGRMAVVVRVVDGDTLDVQFPDARIQRVRLLGIDAPESVAPGQPVECFGPEAAARLHELVQGKMVRLETDASQDTYDRYGRLLAYVFVDSLLVNEVLVREGYAHEYTFRTPYTYQMIFRAAERDAIAHSRGMWARCR